MCVRRVGGLGATSAVCAVRTFVAVCGTGDAVCAVAPAAGSVRMSGGVRMQ
jgi:hypothetical protein